MNLNQLMRQAQQMQKKVNKLKKEFEEKEFEFTSPQDLITGTINGKLELTKLNISESLLEKDNKDMLEDLLISTINENMLKISNEKEKVLNTATGGVDVSAFL